MLSMFQFVYLSINKAIPFINRCVCYYCDLNCHFLSTFLGIWSTILELLVTKLKHHLFTIIIFTFAPKIVLYRILLLIFLFWFHVTSLLYRKFFFPRKIADHKQRAHFINGTWKMLQLVYLHAFFIHWADGWLVSLCLSFVFNWHNKNRNLWSILRSVLIKSSIQIDQQTSNSNVAKYHLFHKKVIQIVYYNYVNNPLISLWLELKQTCDTLCMVILFSQLA